MIAYIQGPITYKTPTQVILDANGIGYELQISLHTYESIKELESCKLFTYLHIMADAHTLYGFYDIAEKQWFLQLIQVNGVGPRMAITILSSLTTQELQQAIIGHHATTLQNIKGIGIKVAQRIILELTNKADKIATLTNSDNSLTDSKSNIKQASLEALLKLGVTKSSAEKAIEQVFKTYSGELTLETVIKLALKL